MSRDDHDELPPVDVDAVVAEARRVLTLGTFDPQAAATALGMDALTLRFCLGLMQGKTATDAMRAAGHPAKKRNALSSAASKKLKTRDVQKFMELAEAAKAGIPDGPMDDQERLRILAKAARSSNAAIQISAVRAHAQLEADLQTKQVDEGNTTETLHAIAAISPLGAVLANELARTNHIEFHSPNAPALPAGFQEWLHAAAGGLNGQSKTAPANGTDARG